MTTKLLQRVARLERDAVTELTDEEAAALSPQELVLRAIRKHGLAKLVAEAARDREARNARA